MLVSLGGGSCAIALMLLVAGGEEVPAATAAVVAQVLGDIAVVGLASLVALRSAGVTRAAWACIAGAFAFWLLSDSGYLAAIVTGTDLGIASVADVGWMAYVVLILVAVTLIYVKLRPERGWQGALDTLALACALCALVWTVSLGPLSLTERIGTVATTLSVLYPASALVAAMAVTWLALRTRGGLRGCDGRWPHSSSSSPARRCSSPSWSGTRTASTSWCRGSCSPPHRGCGPSPPTRA